MIWTDDATERPRRFHGLEAVLHAGTRAQGAASAQALRRALAQPGCVWGYRTHHLMKNPPGEPGDTTCGRCGYTPPAEEKEPQKGAGHGLAAQEEDKPRAARRPRKRRIGLQPGRVTGE